MGLLLSFHEPICNVPNENMQHLLTRERSLARKTLAYLFDVNELGSELLNLELPRRKSLLHTELQGIGIRAPLPELLHE